MNFDAKNLIKNKDYSCIAVKNDTVFYKEKGIGVKPIISPMRQNKNFFKDSFVYDSVIGKAAAALLALSGAVYVYGEIMSESAIEVLEKSNIKYEYSHKVDYIKNRTNDGLCPLENSVKDEFDLEKCFIKIETKINELMNQK